MNRVASALAEKWADGARIPLRAPRNADETGCPPDLLTDLCARFLARQGRLRLRDLAGLVKLPPSVLADILGGMRNRRLVEVAGHSGFEADTEYQLTEHGQIHAREAYARCQYTGPAPVSLEAYRERVDSHSLRHQTVSAHDVRAAFSGLTVAPEVVDQLGAAMNSGRATLIYGPAGSGKTFLAEHLAALQPGHIPVPYAITVGGEIIQVFDPLIHTPLPPPMEGDSMLVRTDRDERWLFCQRPVVLTGGELTLQMLDLQFDPATRFYQAPPHMKANGGVFVVDDLGRQLVAPRDLMNRWIVPLDRSVDYLSLHTGFKFAVPFDMTIIFSTNLCPQAIADEAFLRRFGYKVYLGPLEPAAYQQVFEAVCRAQGVSFDPAGFAWLIEQRHQAEGRPLLACYPRDLVGRVRDFALYEGRAACASIEALARAWMSYFTTAGMSGGTESFQSSRIGGGAA
ncbi:ATP-binding protein [Zoogloea sp.]|uniref:ATP-binding protein n=1 Tax=Zoogloea sp. TaxID=49181 RepID=UPI0031FBC8CE